jgi:hypothetical protein
VTALYACFPVFTFFAALGLLAVMVVLVGAYHKPAAQPHEPVQGAGFTWQWAVAIVITIVVPLLMLIGIWLLPEW